MQKGTGHRTQGWGTRSRGRQSVMTITKPKTAVWKSLAGTSFWGERSVGMGLRSE